jgi:hypothetical protein
MDFNGSKGTDLNEIILGGYLGFNEISCMVYVKH